MTVAGKRGRPATRAEALLGSEPSLSRTLEEAKRHSPRGCDNEYDTRLPILRRRHDGCWFARRWGGRLTIWSSAASEASPLQRRVRQPSLSARTH